MTEIYKIMRAHEWKDAELSGVFAGSEIDRHDGYIHFSSGQQVVETAARHFAGQDGLVLIAFDDAAFGEALKWEASRGGALFPHLYASLPTRHALWVKPLPWNGVAHEFPAELRA